MLVTWDFLSPLHVFIEANASLYSINLPGASSPGLSAPLGTRRKGGDLWLWF